MLTKEELDAIEAKHAPAECTRFTVTLRDGEKAEYVLRDPSYDECIMMQTRIDSPGGGAAKAQRLLVQQCCVYPDRDGFEAILRVRPLLPFGDAMQGWLKRVTGMTAEEAAK